MGLFRLVFDVGCFLAKPFGIVASHFLKELDDLLELRVLELLINMLEIFPSVSPVVDFIQGSRILVLLLGVRVANDFLDLSVPLDDDRFESLDEIFILSVAADQILFGDVELGVTLLLIAGFSD